MRVLDLTRLLPGGFATALLADLGAEVVKVEQPGVGDNKRWKRPGIGGTSGQSWITDRNKRSVAIDLKSSTGNEAFRRLAAGADVVMESFRPGVVGRLGIGYEDLAEDNPALVYCSISGYGQSGPLVAEAGHDINYVGRAGLLSITGPADGRPAIPGVQIGDIGGGGLTSLVGVLAALLRARETGQGDHVDVSLTDAAFSFLSVQLGIHWASGAVPGRETQLLNGRFPCYNVYECADGRFLTVGAIEERFFAALCAAVGRTELEGTRLDAAAVPRWRELFLERPAAEWLRLFDGADACVGPVNDFAEAAADPQLVHREMAVTAADPDGDARPQLGTAVKLRNRPASIRTPAPRLGEHTRECLAAAGYGEGELERLLAEGAIAEPDPAPPTGAAD